MASEAMEFEEGKKHGGHVEHHGGHKSTHVSVHHKRGGKVHHRAKGGGLPESLEEEHKEGGNQGPRVARKRGGHVPGHEPKHRADKRARGGGTSDMHPESSAGKMSAMPYEKKQIPHDDHGEGADRD